MAFDKKAYNRDYMIQWRKDHPDYYDEYYENNHDKYRIAHKKYVDSQLANPVTARIYKQKAAIDIKVYRIRQAWKRSGEKFLVFRKCWKCKPEHKFLRQKRLNEIKFKCNKCRREFMNGKYMIPEPIKAHASIT